MYCLLYTALQRVILPFAKHGCILLSPARASLVAGAACWWKWPVDVQRCCSNANEHQQHTRSAARKPMSGTESTANIAGRCNGLWPAGMRAALRLWHKSLSHFLAAPAALTETLFLSVSLIIHVLFLLSSNFANIHNLLLILFVSLIKIKCKGGHYNGNDNKSTASI